VGYHIHITSGGSFGSRAGIEMPHSTKVLSLVCDLFSEHLTFTSKSPAKMDKKLANKPMQFKTFSQVLIYLDCLLIFLRGKTLVRCRNTISHSSPVVMDDIEHSLVRCLAFHREFVQHHEGQIFGFFAEPAWWWVGCEHGSPDILDHRECQRCAYKTWGCRASGDNALNLGNCQRNEFIHGYISETFYQCLVILM